jgi:hypothetical protein
MTEEPITIGELSRTVASLEKRMDVGFDQVNKRLDALQFVGREAYTIENAQVNKRLDAIEERGRWWGRSMVAVVLLPVLSSFLTLMVVR